MQLIKGCEINKHKGITVVVTALWRDHDQRFAISVSRFSTVSDVAAQPFISAPVKTLRRVSREPVSKTIYQKYQF
jgi:hypothetical protein